MYRHHTGYPGGLKEISFKDMLEKKPDQILIRALLGMLPKNDLRKQMIKQHLTLYTGAYHNYGRILPQFTVPLPRDINADLGVDTNFAGSYIAYASDPNNIPEEFKELPIDIDETLTVPMTARDKTHVNPRENFKLGRVMARAHTNFKKYRKYK